MGAPLPNSDARGATNVAACPKHFNPVFPNEAFTMRPYAGATAAPYPMQLWQVRRRWGT